MKGGTLPAMLPRLTGEFVVIVVGVLFALAVDSWVSDASDRELAREYLQRLLEDVRYDLGKYTFLDSIGRIGLEASLRLSSVEMVRELEPPLLVATVAAAANERQPSTIA